MLWFQHIEKELQHYSWPGNIRELQNVVEYLHNVCGHRCPEISDLPHKLVRELSPSDSSSASPKQQLRQRILLEIQKANAQGVNIGRRTLAALLQIPENQIRNQLQELVADEIIHVSRGRGGIHLQKL